MDVRGTGRCSMCAWPPTAPYFLPASQSQRTHRQKMIAPQLCLLRFSRAGPGACAQTHPNILPQWRVGPVRAGVCAAAAGRTDALRMMVHCKRRRPAPAQRSRRQATALAQKNSQPTGRLLHLFFKRGSCASSGCAHARTQSRRRRRARWRRRSVTTTADAPNELGGGRGRAMAIAWIQPTKHAKR